MNIPTTRLGNLFAWCSLTDYQIRSHSFDIFCLFPKLRDCRYETIEEMKEAVTKVIDTLTQDFHVAFQKLSERYNNCIAAEGDYFEGD